ncbi:histidinol dehydrogenase [Sulfobacillus thermosulfidooxidans DSM 9293]|uniref:Histidinol dehydrogenase n=2 Tax=Sulfobacillus thermosulfidooxidans TaxID=28034 RepID=A0A1W1WHL3_SULTA|nr:histidinol dehydrogenase [Sulfobacillus thermosulfidooxidans DSM 9293]
MITIRHWNRLTDSERQNLLIRGEMRYPDIQATVEKILQEVQVYGDEALWRLEEELDHVDLHSCGLKVTEAEFVAAEQHLPDHLKAAIDRSVANIKHFHLKQLPQQAWSTEILPGVHVGEITRPIASVGLYVPRGKGSFPSVMAMLGVPAVIAGVPQIIVASPPDSQGTIDPAVLYVAKQLGISHVFRLGGAQAIAALAFGTASVPKVAKVLGPGSAYVAVAKQQLAGVIDIGLQSGPSEALIIADNRADPKWVALDWMNEAEHGPDSTVFLLTPSVTLAEQVAGFVGEYCKQLPKPRRQFVEQVAERAGILITPDLFTALDFANDFATEHLVLHVADPDTVLPHIRHAGEILIGPFTPIAAGNFMVGPNAVLPTAGFARSMSALSVRDFLHVTSVLKLSKSALSELAPDIVTLAEYEGFPAHALSVTGRDLTLSGVEPTTNSEQELGIFWRESAKDRVRVTRQTRESVIDLQLSRGPRDEALKEHLQTGIQFLNHMLETIAWRGQFNLAVTYHAYGNGYHLMHVIAEDVGLTLGLAFQRMAQEHLVSGIEGSGFAVGIIDEAESFVALSLEGRPFLQCEYDPAVRQLEHVEDMLTTDLENFLSGFAQGALATLHVLVRRGHDPHHLWESVFRALGEAMNACLRPNAFRQGTTPGVKGI